MNQQRKTIYALRRQVLEGAYVPLLSEAEQKAGKQAPVPEASGQDTVDKLSLALRPELARMAEALTHEAAPPSADGTPAAASPVTVPLDPAKFRSALYRRYGAYSEVSGIAEDRTATLDRLAREVASSLIQQRERILDLAEEVLQELLDATCPEHAHAEDWDLEALAAGMKERFGFEPTIQSKGLLERDKLAALTWEQLEKITEAREQEFSLPYLLYFFRYFILEEIDQRWIEHLKNMEALREGIGLRGYGQKDPKQEYKKEGFVIFGEMMASISRNLCQKLFHIQIQRDESEAAAKQMADRQAKRRPRPTIESGGGAVQAAGAQVSSEPQPVRRAEPKVGRNEPCPCGSGKKYKKCHGATG
jgi:preprotein translocase subunit SecA